MNLFRILFCLASCSLVSLSQTRIPDLPSITGSAVDPVSDLLWLNDTSAGNNSAASKKITLAELVNVSSFTNGNFLAANSVEFSQVNGLTAGLDAKVDDSQLSTTGGANKVLQLDGSGIFRSVPINSDGGVTPPPMQIAARQRLNWEIPSGGNGANVWLFNDHSPSGLGSSHHELLFSSGRFCFYWDDGFQMGNADSLRGNRFLYFSRLGDPTVGDPIRESVPVWLDGQVYNSGGASYKSKIGFQWVPSGTGTGEMVFAISGASYIDGSNGNRLKTLGGAVLPFSISNDGPKVGTGKVLTFGDGSTMSTAPNLQARVGNVTLVAGTKDVADASVTNFTTVQLTRKASGGTIGELTYAITEGVGFTISSSSATDTSRVTYLLHESLVAANSPVVSGTNAVGDTLTVSSGGGSSTWQWYSNNVLVSGQTSSTYVIRHQDIGLPITCREDGVASNAIVAWHPDDESGYFADFRADLGTLTTGGGAAANGQAVEVWQDQSGNARHLGVLATTNAPLLDTSGTGGRPTFLDFDGSNDYMFKVVSTTRPQTVFIVAESKTETANERYFSTADSGTRMIVEPSVPTDVKNVTATTTGDVMPLNTRHIITARTTSSQNAIRVDAASEVVATETTGNGGGMWVSGTSAGAAANQRHYAVLFYQADLDTSAQARVRAYLKAKWGTP